MEPGLLEKWLIPARRERGEYEPGTCYGSKEGNAQRLMETCQKDMSQLQGSHTSQRWDNLSVEMSDNSNCDKIRLHAFHESILTQNTKMNKREIEWGIVSEYLLQNTYYKGKRSNFKKEKSGRHYLTWVIKVQVINRGQSKCGHHWAASVWEEALLHFEDV